MIESVIQSFSDGFVKQSQVWQQLLFEAHMGARAALYRRAANGQERAADCHCRLVLHIISAYLKSLLQPRSLSTQDMVHARSYSKFQTLIGYDLLLNRY